MRWIKNILNAKKWSHILNRSAKLDWWVLSFHLCIYSDEQEEWIITYKPVLQVTLTPGWLSAHLECGDRLGETGLGTICCSENKNFSKIYIPSKSQELCWCHYVLEYLFTFGKNCQTGSWDCWNESTVIMYFLWKRGKKISELNKYSYWYFKKWCNRCSTYQSRGWYVWFLSSPKAQTMLRTPDTLWEMLSRPLITTYQENKTLKPEKNYHSTEMVISPDTDQHGSILCKTQPVIGLKSNLILQYRLSTDLFQVFCDGAW